ncbi:hypothetical protein V8C26DRAFT_322774 [Trichoderma gracile]
MAPSIQAPPVQPPNGAARPVAPSHLLPEFSMKDKVVVVSGGGRGLGLVQAEALIEAGAVVHCIDILPDPSTDPTSEFAVVAARAKKELNSHLTYHRVDVTEEPQVTEVFEKVAEKEGRLDGCLVAAGINYESPALEYSPEQVDRMLRINVKGAFLTAQGAARIMVRFGTPGSICLIASMSGTIANRGMFASLYNTSKAGVMQMARSLAAEWGVHGIRVNTLSPGYCTTQMLLNLFEQYPERKAQWPSENMLQRFSEPKEYRGAALFLLSDASSFMTGSDLRIDGGHAAW